MMTDVVWFPCLGGLWPPVRLEAAHPQELSHVQQRGQTVIVHLPHPHTVKSDNTVIGYQVRHGQRKTFA